MLQYVERVKHEGTLSFKHLFRALGIIEREEEADGPGVTEMLAAEVLRRRRSKQ